MATAPLNGGASFAEREQEPAPVDFAGLMPDVAALLLGTPNDRLSKGDTLRFGTHGSMQVHPSEGWFYDHETKTRGGVLDLIMHKRGCDMAGSLSWLEDEGLKERTKPERTFYDYHDESGAILFKVQRKGRGDSKTFVQHGPDGCGRFVSRPGCMKGVRRVLYRLPALVAADPGEIVFVCEGEKDADRLDKLGLVATTNAGGALKFTADLAPPLRGRRVALLEDNDDAGRKHVADVAAKLKGIAAAVGIVRLEGLPEKGDVSDWLNRGGSAGELLKLAEAALVAGPADSSADPQPANDTANRKRPNEPTEDAIALAFTARYGSSLRFDHHQKKWFEWNGKRWQQDDRRRAFDYTRQMAREFGETSLCRASVAKGAEAFACADPVHSVTSEVWNADPMLLGTPGGVVDLRTGKLRKARPEDMITKLTAVAPEDGDPELWLRFLGEAVDHDEAVIRFLQQWFGYSLTGATREHALLFLHGLGGTGKTTFLNILKEILGDYAITAAMETFVASKYDRHSTELAMLHGARLVTASETEEGRAWAEAKIKQMTGGDPITARFMRQDNFTFRPQFKLTIVGNNAPRLVNPDDAMRRRFNIVGFNIKPAAPDPLLETKLKAEHGRILAWAIAGCLDWQAKGLVRPDAVKTATTDYFADQDVFGQWLDERCEIGPNKWEQPTVLFSNWSDYARAAGDDPGSMVSLSDRLKRRGFARDKVGGIRAYKGLALIKPKPKNPATPSEDYGDDYSEDYRR